MGFFNDLITNIQCSNCNSLYEIRIQYKFGATRQLEYRLGDKIIWGYNEIGKPDMSKVKALGITDNDECPICHHKNQNEYFDIYLEKDVITKFDKMQDAKDFFMTEGCYKVLVE